MLSFHLYLYGPNHGPFSTSFEETAKRLERLTRMFFEQDGSFVWTPESDQQIDGMLYDAQGKLQYVELKGICTLASWRVLLIAIGGDSQNGVVMVIPTRELKDLPTFERAHWPLG